MFANVLIANRGEIACRIIRTARAMGLRSLAVFTPADRGALFTRLADEAHEIGPGDDAYLDGAQILALGRRLGAQCLHPGYGFLSENANFAESCAQAGIAFVGPSAEAMRALGLKSHAKAAMRSAGVPVVPGTDGIEQDAKVLAELAGEVGYPLLVKAIAGGGGRGMRRVDAPADFPAQLASARREALGAFGDDRVLLEKYVAAARHLEVQIFGDARGGLVQLGERECSLQRRRQKIIEESPAPGLSDEMRHALGQAALKAGAAVRYVGAGTVEFIADISDGLREDRFYFMEMNTRLQVEHPVTEMVTGLDLVEWQFRVAAGQALPLAQDEIRFRGCAMEARLYAEDPDAGFLPSPGRIHRLQLPSGEGLRVDAGVEAGDGVSGAYDPMIAKIIAFAPSRAQALARLAAALRQSVVIGPKTNLNFLLALAKAPAFRDGAYHTQLIDDGLQGLVAPQDSGDRRAILAAAMAICAREWDSRPDAGLDPWSTADSFELTGLRQRRIDLMVDGRRVEFALHADGGELSLRLGDAAMAIGAATPGDVSLHATPEAAFAFANGRQHRVAALDFAMLGGAGQGEAAGRVEAPMPGRLIAVLAREGEAVERGARLAILEAMKMEHTIIAPRAGMVARIQAAIGAQVAQGDVLMLVEAAGDPQN